jgi:hypothetical protein
MGIIGEIVDNLKELTVKKYKIENIMRIPLNISSGISDNAG